MDYTCMSRISTSCGGFILTARLPDRGSPHSSFFLIELGMVNERKHNTCVYACVDEFTILW